MFGYSDSYIIKEVHSPLILEMAITKLMVI